MLKVTEHTPTRMVLEDKQQSAGVVAALFTAFSAISVLLLIYNTVITLILGQPKDLMAWRYFGVSIFLLMMIGFVVVGALITVQFLRGVTLTIDKHAEEVTLQQPHFFRLVLTRYPIYGVARLDVETNAELRSHGLILVMRSGERVPIAAYPVIDQEPMERVVEQIRAYLRTVGGWG